MYCDPEYSNCNTCEYALKEFGQVYGCQREEDEINQSYIQWLKDQSD